MGEIYTMSELIDLVRELRKENERLKEENKFCHKTITENAQRALEVTIEEIDKAKIETINKFVEEYKDQIKNYTGIFTDDGFYVSLQAVLNAVDFIKEKLVGE